MILKCNCKHTYQDKRYGDGKRVHNKCRTGKYRCTVCSDVKEAQEALRKGNQV